MKICKILQYLYFLSEDYKILKIPLKLFSFHFNKCNSCKKIIMLNNFMKENFSSEVNYDISSLRKSILPKVYQIKFDEKKQFSSMEFIYGLIFVILITLTITILSTKSIFIQSNHINETVASKAVENENFENFIQEDFFKDIEDSLIIIYNDSIFDEFIENSEMQDNTKNAA